MCLLYDYGFGERPRGASSVCMHSLDSTYRVRSVSGRCVLCESGAGSRCHPSFSVTDQPCGAAHQPMQWGASGDSQRAQCSSSHPITGAVRSWCKCFSFTWLHFPACAMQRGVHPRSAKHTEIKGWRVLHNCKVSLFNHALVGALWNPENELIL